MAQLEAEEEEERRQAELEKKKMSEQRRKMELARERDERNRAREEEKASKEQARQGFVSNNIVATCVVLMCRGYKYVRCVIVSLMYKCKTVGVDSICLCIVLYVCRTMPKYV